MTHGVNMVSGKWQIRCKVCSNEVPQAAKGTHPDAITLIGRTHHKFCSRACLEKWLAKRKQRI